MAGRNNRESGQRIPEGNPYSQSAPCTPQLNVDVNHSVSSRGMPCVSVTCALNIEMGVGKGVSRLFLLGMDSILMYW